MDGRFQQRYRPSGSYFATLNRSSGVGVTMRGDPLYFPEEQGEQRLIRVSGGLLLRAKPGESSQSDSNCKPGLKTGRAKPCESMQPESKCKPGLKTGSTPVEDRSEWSALAQRKSRSKRIAGLDETKESRLRPYSSQATKAGISISVLDEHSNAPGDIRSVSVASSRASGDIDFCSIQ